MSCIFSCSTRVEAVSPQPSAPNACAPSHKVAQAHRIILNSIPGSVNARQASSPLLDQQVILLSPPKASLGFRPIPSEDEIIHTELPPSHSTKTTPDEELTEDPISRRESPDSASSESAHDTPAPSPRSTPPKGIPGWTIEGSTPSDEELTPADYPEEIYEDDETPGELILPPPKNKGRSLNETQTLQLEPTNLQTSPQTALSYLISLNSQMR